MKRISKILGLIGLVLLASVVALGVGLVLANLHDEPLDAAVEKILAERHADIAVEENGYFALIGVHGPEDKTPHEWGLRWHNAASKADREGSGGSKLLAEQEQTLFALPREAPCQEIDHCLEEVVDHPDQARRVLEKARGMLERCDQTLDYSQFQEPWRSQMSLASALPLYPSACRDLQSIHFALAVARHQDEAAIVYLGRVMKFHTLHLQGSVTLLSKVVAISHLTRDYRLLNQYLLLRPAESRRQLPGIKSMLALLSDKARSMEDVLKSEFTLAARGFLDLQGLVDQQANASDDEGVSTGLFDEVLTSLLYLPHATVNEYYCEISPFINLEQTSGRTYRELALAMDNERQGEEHQGRNLYTLRNPVGHILIQIGLANFLPYLKARDNMLALRALVAFQFELLSRGLTDAEAIERALTQAQLVHRYTGEVSIWNREDRSLSFPESAASGREPIGIRL
jgi:hypothetical protein